ncbi:MAG TPA: diguanylate cyclase [Aquabacterium sp.]|uniref:GGDEF domain-containing protein n=1 Tax=Aquabacterium sp. TaxID=1872578 RepID=UPI002E372147|nr:diguanylate cyclase [Aquabacterium sp.]HEX5356865.1 diguanylate cyclase [Aquabacterium sp.]
MASIASVKLMDAPEVVASGQSALVSKTLADGFALLTFPRELEDRFLTEGEARRFHMMVVAGVAAVCLFGAMIIGDYLLSPGVVRFAAVLREAVFPPAIFIGLYLLRRLRMPALNEWMIALAGVLAALLEVAIVLRGEADWAVARVVQLNIIMVFTCVIARFWPAVMMALAVAGLHGHVVATMPDATGMMSFNTSLLLGTSIAFVLYGNYKQEHDERMSFLLEAREQALHASLTEAHDRLSHLATTDALTQVANRRYVETYLSECWQAARAQGTSLSLILVDVDYFKPYNDRYGHQAGDRCLVAVAEALRGCIRRPGDLVARWGGEEFVVVLLDADVDATEAAAARLRLAVSALQMPHEASLCAAHVTISGGWASVHPNEQDDWPQWVQLVDEALYGAKHAGRHRMHAAQGMMPHAAVASEVRRC